MSSPHYKTVSSPSLKIQIRLDDNVKTFTSSDHVNGVVMITALEDTPFSELDIELLGITGTSIKAPSAFSVTPGRSESYERILEMQQPDTTSRCPSDRTFRAGCRYQIGFDFVVPEHMLTTRCCHKSDATEPDERHTRLPPTIGDIDNAMDACFSSNVCIRYRLVARVWRAVADGRDPRRTLLNLTSERIRLVPSSPAQPPLPDQVLRNFLTQRKVKMSRNPLVEAGKLIVSTAEPYPLQLRSPPDAETNAGSALLHILLQFSAPGILARPPRLGRLEMKVDVETYAGSYSCQAADSPNKLLKVSSRTISLPSRQVTDVVWTNHQPVTKYETAALAHNTSFHTAELMAAIVLPCDKDIVPTFETCLVGRRYRIIASLEVNRIGVAKTVELQVPLQVSMGSPARRSSLHGFASESMPDLMDTEEHKQVQVSLVDRTGRARGISTQSLLATDEPPDYDARDSWESSFRRDSRPFR